MECYSMLKCVSVYKFVILAVCRLGQSLRDIPFACILDPKLKLHSIDLEVKLPSIETEELHQNTKGY